MGAYYNPEVAKDYTPEITAAWSKAANDVTGGVVKVIEAKTDEYNALSKKYIANRAAVEQSKLALLKDVGKSTSGYLGADWQQAFKPAIDKYADLNLKIANNVGSPEDRAKYQKELVEIEAAIDLTKDGVATMVSYSEGADKKLATAGNQGGYDATADTNLTNALLCGNGKIAGTKGIVLAPDKDGNWNASFTFAGKLTNGTAWGDPADPSKPYTIDARKINQISKNGNQLISTIPVIDNNIQEFTNASSSADGTTLFSKTTKIGPDGKPITAITGANKKYYINETEVSVNKTDTTETFAKKSTFDTKAFRTDLLKDANFKAQVDGLLADPQGFCATLNNTFGSKKADNTIWKITDFQNPTLLAEATKQYTDKFADYVTNLQAKEVFEENPITKQVSTNQTKNSPLEIELNALERSHVEGTANYKDWKGKDTLRKTIEINKVPVKVILKKDANGKVTAEKA